MLNNKKQEFIYQPKQLCNRGTKIITDGSLNILGFRILRLSYELNLPKHKKTSKNFLRVNEAINYANRNKIEFRLIEPKRRRIVIKSYADNFK